MKNSSDPASKAKDAFEKAKEKMATSKLSAKINPTATLDKASKLISGTSKIGQFLIGGTSGWCTGFLTTRVGGTACVIAGGSILFVGSLANAGLINVNWDKLGKDAETKVKTVQGKIPAITKAMRGGKITPMFATGFVGGFLLGVIS